MAIRNEFEGQVPGDEAVDAEPILVVAQNDPDTASEPAPAATAVPATLLIEVEDGSIVRLPEGANIDAPRVNGENLEFVQPDGTVIVIPGGAIQGLTIFIGNIEIPPQTVAALFEANDIQAAAGPDGAAGAPGSGGGNFIIPPGGIGPGLAFGALLPPTDLSFGALSLDTELGENLPPRFAFGAYSGRVSEEGLNFRNADSTGSDDTTDSIFVTGDLGASDPNGDPLSFSFGLPTTPMTSNGVAITWTGVGTGILTGWAGSTPVVIAIVGGATGTYLVTLLQPIDHAIAGVEDEFALDLTITVSDGQGLTASTVLTVIIEDDSPLLGETPAGVVDEDGLANSYSNGNGNSDSDGDADGNAVSATGSLAIAWGADIGDKGADTTNPDGSFVQDGALGAALTGRAVYFADDTIAAAGARNGTLTSRGDIITITLEDNGTRLVARAGGSEGSWDGDIYYEGEGRIVFEVTLSDEGTGAYEFRLYDQLDHAIAGTEDNIALTFDFTARDADGDTATGTFTVVVDDDMPIALTPRKYEDESEEEGEWQDSFGVTATVVEDALSTSNGDTGDLSEGNLDADQDTGDDEASGGFGSLTGLFAVGADEELTISIASNLSGLPTLYSKGEAVTYSVLVNNNGTPDDTSDDTHTLTATAGVRTVFTLTVQGDGSWSFDLDDQLDHVAASGDSGFALLTSAPGAEITSVAAIDFSSIIVATDFDGDSAIGATTGGFTIAIENDVPVLVYENAEFRTVDEDDIVTNVSTGTNPEDGDIVDGSFTGNSGVNNGGPATVTGELAPLVKAGADEALTFDFQSDAVATLSQLGLMSKGRELSYEVRGNMLYGFVNVEGIGQSFNAEQGDRAVFKLTLDDDGSYKFELIDQLDHDRPNVGADENFDLQDDVPNADVDYIDFGSVIKATDFDGDSVNLDGVFTIDIRDDVPELIVGKAEFRTVDEDDIVTNVSTGTNPEDGDIVDGSFTGNPGVSAGGPATITGDLALLVKPGADEALTFDFQSNAVATLSQLGLTSKGRELSYEVRGNMLYGFVNAEGIGVSFDPPADRAVFKLTLDDDGSYKFELIDQLDHDLGDGENLDLQDGVPNADVDYIDFGSVIKATDFDGDSVNLDGVFTIDIRDDVPELIVGKAEFRTVDEDDIVTNVSTGTNPEDGDIVDGSFTGNPGVSAGGPATITGDLALLVKPGADEALTFDFQSNAVATLSQLGLTSKGRELSYEVRGNMLYGFVNAEGIGVSFDPPADRAVFKLTLDNDGSYKFELIDQLDHDRPNVGADENFDLQDDVPNADVDYIDFGSVIKATDFDGDSVNLNGVFTIDIRDDVPEAREDGSISGVVEEEQLHDGNEDVGPNPLDEDHQAPNDYDHTTLVAVGNAANGQSLLSLIEIGADEQGEFSLRSGVSKGYAIRDLDGVVVESNGHAVSIKDIETYSDRVVITAGTQSNTVFVLTIWENGNWRFELKDQLDHHSVENADDIEGLLQLDLSSLVKFTDFDGDSIELNDGSFVVKVIDDVPVADIEQRHGATLVLDETKANSPQDTFADPNADDEEGIANPFPAYGNLIAYTKGRGDDIFDDDSSVGADQNGEKEYSVYISGTGTDSGLDDTATGQDILLYMSGDNIVGRVGGAHGPVAFVIRIDANDGDVRVYQYRAVEHDNDGSSQSSHDESSSPEIINAGKIFLEVTVTDEDGDEASDSFDLGKLIKFEDDGPKVLGNNTVELDDDDVVGANGNPGGPNDNPNAPDDETGTLNFNAGSDGLQHVKLTGVSLPSGLGFSQTVNGDGSLVTIFQNGTPVITVTLNTATGGYEVQQLAPIDHPTRNGQSGDDTENDVEFTVNYRVTDKDGDWADGTLKVNVDDDTPVQNYALKSGILLTADETNGLQNATATPGVPGDSDDHDSAAAFPVAVANIGTDPHMAAPVVAQSAGSFFTGGASFGADGPGATVFSIDAVGANSPSEKVSSGLFTTEGREIFLFEVSPSLVVGRYDAAGGGSGATTNTDPAAFAIHIDPVTGVVSVIQYVSIKHDDRGDFDESNDNGTPGNDALPDEQANYPVQQTILNNVLRITIATTDHDGDTVTQQFNVGNKISFEDDGPSLTLSQPNSAANGLFFDGFVDNSPTWGQGSGINTTGTAGAWTITASPVDGAANVQLERVGDLYRGADSPTNSLMVDLEASPGNVQVSQTINLAAGIYSLSFEIGEASDPFLAGSAILQVLWNGVPVGTFDPNPGAMQTISLDVTAIGGSNSLTFREIGDAGDNTGTYLANVRLTDVIIVDETAGLDADSDEIANPGVFGGINAGTDPHMPAPQFARGSGAIVTANAIYGADGPATINALVYEFTLASNAGIPSGLTTTEGQPISLFKDDNGRILGVYDADGNGISSADSVAFALHINPATGVVSVAQYVSLDHPDVADSDEGIYLAANTLSVKVTATDGDGDPISASADVSARIRFEDDGPQMNQAAPVIGSVEEDGLSAATGGNDGANLIPDNKEGNKQAGDDNTQDQVSGLSGSLNTLVNFGADGPGAFSINSAALASLPTLYSGGLPVSYALSGNTLTASNSLNQVVFTLTVNADGSWSFDLDGQLDHVDDSNTENLALRTNADGTTSVGAIDFSAIIIATDGDGDPLAGLAPSAFKISVEDDIPTIASPAIGPNLIQNGSFETFSNPGLSNGQWELYDSIPGWTKGTDGVPFEIQVGGAGGLAPPDGTALVELDGDYQGNPGVSGGAAPAANTHATIQQSNIPTVAGGVYQLTFYYSPRANDGDGTNSAMEVLWNGVVVQTLDGSTQGWQQITLNLAAAGNDTLAFRAVGSAAEQNELGAFLDNVSLVALNSTTVDEDGLLAGNHDAAPDDDIVPNEFFGFDGNEATNLIALGITWGADSVDQLDAPDSGTSPDAVAYLTVQQDAPDGLGDRSVTFTNNLVTVGGVASLTSQGEAVSFTLSPDGTRILGATAGGRQVIEIRLSDELGGFARVALLDQLDHAPGAAENNLSLTFNFTATDSDGDSATGSFSVNIDDDMPVASDIVQSNGVYENELRNGTHKGLDTDDENGDGNGNDSYVKGNLSALVDFGADAPGLTDIKYIVELDNLATALTGLTSGGFPLTFSMNPTPSENMLIAKADGVQVFYFQVDRVTGQYTFQLSGPLDHTPGSDAIVLDMSSAVTARDADGDLLPLSGQLFITVNDDVPLAVADDAGTIPEDAPFVYNVLANDKSGADGGLKLVGATLASASAGAGLVTFDANGSVTFDPAPGFEGAVVIDYVIEDSDGDQIPSTLSLTVDTDSVPSVTVTDGIVDEKGLPARNGEPAGSGESADGNGTDNDDTSETTTGTFTIGTGGDTLGALEIKDSGGNWINVTAATVGAPVTVQGATGVLTVTSDGSGNYSWSYTLTDNLLTHDDIIVDGDSDRGTADQKPGEAFAVRVTDNEGDVSATDTLGIIVNDDGPIVQLADPTPTTIEEPGGGAGFGGDGKVLTDIGGSNDYGQSVTIQPDGKIVVAGYGRNGSTDDFALVRYNADGTLDASFGGGDGKLFTDIGGLTDRGQGVTIQPDGKILVAGFGHNGSTFDFALARYNSDGSLDSSFDGDGKLLTDIGPTDQGYGVAVQADGKILVAGYSYNGSSFDFALVRYNADGSLDTGFGSGGKVLTDIGGSTDGGQSVVVQPDGKILVSGYGYNGLTSDFALVRYNADGSLDTGFGSGGKILTDVSSAQEFGRSVTVQPDGKILVSGEGYGSSIDVALVRYNADGSLDTGFGSGGTVLTDIGGDYDGGLSVTVQPDGKIVVAGYSWNGSTYDFSLVRYNANGSLDTGFGGGDGKVLTDIGGAHDLGLSVALQPDGKIVVAGYSWNGSNYDFAVVRYNTDGSLDVGGVSSTPTTASIDLAPLVAFGADGPHATTPFEFISVGNAAFGVAAEGGAPILLTNVNGVLIGHTAGNVDDPVFKLEIVNGKAVLTLYSALDQGQAEFIALDFSAYIRAIDGDGDAIQLDIGKVVFNVEDANTPLTINPAGISGLVEEEHGLAGGIEDGNSPLDTDPSPEVSNVTQGSFAGLVTGGIDGSLSFSFAALSGNPAVTTTSPAGNLTSDGKQVYFDTEGGNLIGYYNANGDGSDYDSAADIKVFTVTLASDGSYTFTLHQPVDHAIDVPATEDTLTINLNGLVTVTDSGGPASDTNVALNASITVIDDIPVQADINRTVVAGGKDTNLMLILDLSGSMNDASGMGGSRLDVLKPAAIQLIQLYEALGDVSVNIVIFKDSTAAKTSVNWDSAADAIAYINSLHSSDAGGGTNYEEAVATAQDAWDDAGKQPGVPTVSYFLSDGDPAPDEDGLDDGEETAWTTFLNNNDIQQFALGLGTDIANAQLDRVAYDGTGAGTNTNGIIITDLSQLDDTLSSTVTSISGNVITESGPLTGYGADGPGYVKSITVNGVTYTFNGTNAVSESGATPAGYDDNGTWIEVPTALGGTLTFYFAQTGANAPGSWSYVSPANATGNESFAYKIVDNDGDEGGANLNITVVSKPTLSVSDATEVTEGGQSIFTVSLSHAFSSSAIPVSFAAVAGSAVAADYNGAVIEWSLDGTTWSATPFSFAPGQVSVQVRVTTINDALDEATESYSLIAASSGTANASDSGSANILDNDNPPSLSINDMTVNETAGTITFTVTLSAVSGQQVQVNYAVNEGTATNPEDYTGTLGSTLTFAPGTTTQTITLNIVNDTAVEEPNETFTVTLSGAVNATISDGSGTGTIDSEDVPNAAPEISNLRSSLTFTEGDSPVRIDSNVDVDDSDSSNFSTGSLTVAISQNGQSSDELKINEGNDIEISGNDVRYDPPGNSNTVTFGTWSGGTNGNPLVFQFNASATPALVERLIERIAFENTSQNPSSLARQLTFTLTDGDGGTEVVTTTVNVVPVNDAPTITAPNGGNTANVSVLEGTTAVTDVDATDPEGTPLTYSIVGTAGTDFDKFTINASTGVLTFIAAPDYEGPDDVGGTDNDRTYVLTVQVTDGTLTDTQIINVTVTNDPNDPVANDNIVIVNGNASDNSTLLIPEWALLWNDSDPQGDPLDITSVSQPSDLASVDLANNPGSVTVINNSQAGSGNDTDWGEFKYVMTAGAQTDPAKVTIEIDNDSTLDRDYGSGNGGADIFIDTLSGGHVINAGGGNDVLIGNDGNDTLNGELDNDLLVGGSGEDTLLGGDGNDDLFGGADNDKLYGDQGNDRLFGEGGNDNLQGLSGNDFLSGGDGDDVLHGGGTVGDDVLVGGSGFNTLIGGPGADRFVIDTIDIADLITDYSGVGGEGDKVDLTALFSTAPGGGNVTDFVNYNAATGALSVDANGLNGGSNFQTVATLGTSTHPTATSITIIFDDGTNTFETTANNI